MMRTVILTALLLLVACDGYFTFQCYTVHPNCPSISAFVFVGSQSEQVVCTGSKKCPTYNNYTMDCSNGDTTKVSCSTTEGFCPSGSPYYSIESSVGSGYRALYFCMDGPCVFGKVKVNDLCGASYFWVIVGVVVGVIVVGVIAGVLCLRWRKKKKQQREAEAYKKMPDPNTDTIITSQ